MKRVAAIISYFRKRPKIYAASLFASGIIAGIIFSYLGFIYPKIQLDNNVKPFRAKDEKYNLIAPLLFCQTPNNSGGKLNILNSQINNLINSAKATSEISTASVYYRDPVSADWLSINENEKYTPASLLKVAVMMAYLKKSEDQPETLSQNIQFTQDIKNLYNEVPNSQPSELVVGRSYQVSDLIRRMVAKSDNGATYSLLSRVDDSVISQIYADLGLPDPSASGRNYTITTNYYVRFLRVLYNATYLNQPMSQLALDIMSQDTFNQGLKASLPANIAVADKYGESVLTDKNNNQTIELHDCGIVYAPNNPYMVCVMTRGKNLDDLKKFISDSSRTIYNFATN